MERTELIAKAEQYWEKNWPAIKGHIASLVRIPSVEDLSRAEAGAPFGPEPKRALSTMLHIADELGFETTDAEGYIGFADLAGDGAKAETQIGIIGHMDVVAAGPGWHFEPYDVTEKDGYLIGRGVMDDKGPSVVTLHAMKFLNDLGFSHPYTIRFLFGANEETDMGDVAYYREHYADPAFLFTPDADFPVCYGEKGGFDATITSAPIANPTIKEFKGGVATNAVPGSAYVVVQVEEGIRLPQADNLTISCAAAEDAHGQGRFVRIEAAGKSAHASTPEEGVNAVFLIVDYLLENNLCNDQERAFLEFDRKLLGETDGSGVGIASADTYFGPLTVIGGTMDMKDGCFVQTMDSRFPTSITPEEITSALVALTEPLGATFENTLLMPPFLVDPKTPAIQTLLSAYNGVTGENREAFTIGGGTYAREFSCGASFGPEMAWLETPDWAGDIHGPDEAVSIEQLKTAFVIYAVALHDLQKLELA